MNPWRAALTSATASGNRTRIASRSASACSSAPPFDLHARERGGGQLDRGVQGQRRELLALRLGDRLCLLLGELAQPAHQILGIAAEGEVEAAFHRFRLAELELVTAENLGLELADDRRAPAHRLAER